jgi:ABC-type branched-subunit amino acid transport system substrate-binding protein
MKETKTRQSKRGFATIALPILLMVFLILLGLTPTAECAEKAVTFLGLVDYSGPVAGLSADIARGQEDYSKEVNSRGGVNGIKINCINIDTRYNVARAVSGYRRYRRGYNVIAVSFHSTPFGKALRRDTVRDKIVGFYPADGEIQGKNIPGFSFVTTYQDGFGATLDWLVADWKKKGKGGRPVVGYISWDSAYGRESLKGGKEYAETLPLKLLPPEYFPVGALDHTVYLQRLAKGGANYIIIGGVDPTPTNIMKDAHRMGLTKNIQFMNNSYWGPATTIGIRMHPEVLENFVMAAPYLKGEEAEKHPVAQLWKKWRPHEPFSNFTGTYFVGAGLIMDVEAGLKIALKKVSYEKLDGKILADSIRQLTNSTHRQGVGPPTTFSPTNNRAGMEVKFYRIKKGKLVSISDWVKAPDTVSMHKWK